MREALMGGIGMDDKRKGTAWFEYGWPETITYQMVLGVFRRNGLASGATNKLANTCWSTLPWVIEGEADDVTSPWEKEALKVLTPRVWRAFKEADLRRLIGGFSGLIIHIADGKPWDQPVTGGKHRVVKVEPAWRGALDPVRGNNAIGAPEYWNHKSVDGVVTKIHADRIFILGDYDDPRSWLEPAYNALVNIEKVEGGSGESFLKNAARQLNIDFDKEIDLGDMAATYGVSIAELQEKFNDTARDVNSGNDIVMPTQGATITPLVTNVPDPSPTYNINLQTVSAALDIPSRVLVGNQQGERASTEDQKYFDRRCQSRRINVLNFDIEDFVDHLIRINLISANADYSVQWDDLTAQGVEGRLEVAAKMAMINQSALATGAPVFSDDEIRIAAGYESRDYDYGYDEEI